MLRQLDRWTRNSWPRKAALKIVRRLLPGLNHSTRFGLRLTPIVPVQVRGFTYFVDNSERWGISRILIDDGDYGHDEIQLLASLLKPGGTFLNVGANIGFFAVQAAGMVGPSGRVIAFEPAPAHVKLLRRTIGANRLANLTVLQKAVSDRSGTVELQLSSENTGDHRIYGSKSETRTSVTVPLTTIDAELAALGTQRVDVMMMDIQGAEGLAVKGMRHTLASNPDLVALLEFWPVGQRQAGSDPRQLLDEFLKSGRRIYASCERFSGSDLTRRPVTVPSESCRATDFLRTVESDDRWVNLVITRRPLLLDGHQEVLPD